MTRFVLRTVFTMLLTFIVLSQYAIAQRSDTSAWKPEEMTRSGTKDLKSFYKNKKVEVKALHVWLNNLKRHLEENNLKEEPPTNCSDQCFDLYYFTGNNFNRLILEAPIVRNIDFAGQRTEMALNNLEKIYRLISSEPSEPCDCTGRALIAAFDDGTPSHTEANNFCFLTPPTSSPENLESRIKTIRDSLKEIYKNLEEEYGVLGFLTENYDSEQKNSRYKSLFGYPKEFVFAL